MSREGLHAIITNSEALRTRELELGLHGAGYNTTLSQGWYNAAVEHLNFVDGGKLYKAPPKASLTEAYSKLADKGNLPAKKIEEYVEEDFAVIDALVRGLRMDAKVPNSNVADPQRKGTLSITPKLPKTMNF